MNISRMGGVAMVAIGFSCQVNVFESLEFQSNARLVDNMYSQSI